MVRSGEKVIDFSGLGGVPVLAFRTVCSSAVSERGSVRIDVERGGRAHRRWQVRRQLQNHHISVNSKRSMTEAVLARAR